MNSLAPALDDHAVVSADVERSDGEQESVPHAGQSATSLVERKVRYRSVACLSGHFPHLPPTPKPIGLGAEVPTRTVFGESYAPDPHRRKQLDKYRAMENVDGKRRCIACNDLKPLDQFNGWKTCNECREYKRRSAIRCAMHHERHKP